MANQLKMAQIDTILALHRRCWSNRRIAKELGIHRETVARHIEEASRQSKPARAPIGSEPALDDSKPATAEGGAQPAKPANDAGGAQPLKTGQALIGSEPAANRQASLCEPWRVVILNKLEAGLTAADGLNIPEEVLWRRR
jgi:DNA-binding transcriptional MocR family regulator